MVLIIDCFFRQPSENIVKQEIKEIEDGRRQVPTSSTALPANFFLFFSVSKIKELRLKCCLKAKQGERQVEGNEPC